METVVVSNENKLVLLCESFLHRELSLRLKTTNAIATEVNVIAIYCGKKETLLHFAQKVFCLCQLADLI